MQKKYFLLTIVFSVLFFSACKKKPDADVVISTELGDISIKLYNETPKHKANFLKLAKEGYYDGTTFHRILKEFMIQGGDPNSKDTTFKGRLGQGGPNYELEAEITPNSIHKRGALCAARLADEMNPQRKSSGSQFYIVHGKKYSDGELDTLELMKKNMQMRTVASAYQMEYLNKPENKWFEEIISKQDTVAYKRLQEKYPDSLKHFEEKFKMELDVEMKKVKPIKISPERRKIYKTIGGSPQLDDDYTVFGEVTAGMEVVDKIAALETDPNDAPKKRIKIKVKVVEKK